MESNNNLNQEILDKITKVCLCKAISRKKIKDAISDGANTYDEVKEMTGAGAGSCNGARCKHKIEELIEKASK